MTRTRHALGCLAFAFLALAGACSGETTAMLRDDSFGPDTIAPGRYRIDVSSVADKTLQPSYLYVPPTAARGQARYPLIVVLHMWNFDLEQRFPEVEADAASRGWLLLTPNFRGANDHPEACGSSLAQQDILDAVDWVQRHFAVDDRRIYLMGASGGGHMTMLMAAHHPSIWAGASAWVGISDLTAWYVVGEGGIFGENLRGCLGGSPLVAGSSAAAEASARSPITYLSPGRTAPLDIVAGRDDGTVSVSHSLRAFQAIAPDLVSDAEIQQLLVPGPGLLAPNPGDTTVDPVLGRRTYLRRISGSSRVTIFDGAHEWMPLAAMAWLADQKK